MDLIHYKLNPVLLIYLKSLKRDVCVFLIQHEWRIGKVLQFYYTSGNGQKSQQCKETSINLKQTVKTLVLCVIGSAGILPYLYKHTHYQAITELYTSYSSLVNDYAFTLSDKCFKLIQAKESVDVTQGVLLKDSAKIKLPCAKYITLSEESVIYLSKFIIYLLKQSCFTNRQTCNEDFFKIKFGKNMAATI